jgi:hypothetical protein
VPGEERYFTKIDGGHVFFPYGALSFRRGYIVDDAKKAELIALLKRLNRSSLPLMLIAAVAGWGIAGADGLWLGLGLIALPGMVYYQFTVRRLLAGMPRTDHRRELSEQLRATADAVPSYAIYVALAAILFVTVIDAFFIYGSVRNRDVGGVLLFAISLPIFTLLLLLTARLFYLKGSRRNLSGNPPS